MRENKMDSLPLYTSPTALLMFVDSLDSKCNKHFTTMAIEQQPITCAIVCSDSVLHKPRPIFHLCCESKGKIEMQTATTDNRKILLSFHIHCTQK